MRLRVLIAGMLLSVAMARAEQPAHDLLTGKLYLLKSDAAFASKLPIPRQGVFAYDVNTRKFTKVAPFGFITTTYFGNQVALGATADRFIVQGTDYFEYDLVSGRLLRRYPGIAIPAMRFRGTVVTEEQTAALGIPAGVYGFFDCSAAADDQRLCPGSSLAQLPGGDPGAAFFDRLLHRGASPEMTQLGVARSLPASEGQLFRAGAFVSLDPKGKRFLIWRLGGSFAKPTGRVQQIASFPLVGDQAPAVLHEMVWDQTSSNAEQTLAQQFTFQPFLRSFFIKFVSGDGSWRFVRWPEDLSTEEIVLSGSGNSANLGAMASLIEELPSQYTQVIPLVRHADDNGALWRSELWLFNPSEESMDVSIRRVARAERTASYRLEPHASKSLGDALKQLGGGATPGGGDGVESDALVITSSYRWGAQLAAYSRTSTVSPRPEDRGGSLGFTAPAVPGNVGYSTHTPYFQYSFDTDGSQVSLILDKRDPSRFRHAIGVVNDGDQPLEVRLRYTSASTLPYDPSSPIDKRFSVAPHSVGTQEIESLFPAQFSTDRPPRIWVSADRPAPIWMSMTDTTSGDVTLVPYTLFALRADPTTEMAIPAVGSGFGSPSVPQPSGRRRALSATGSTASPWHTDLFGFFLTVDSGEENQQPLATFDPASDRCAASSRRLSGVIGWNRQTEGVEPFWKSIFPDVAGQFSCAGGGALRLRGSSWMAGFARNYLTRPDGGTVGDILPFYPPEGWPVQHFSGIKCGSETQTTIGLYNGAAYSLTNRLLLYDATGRLLAQKEIELASRASAQVKLSDLVSSCTASGPYGLSVVPIDKPDQPGRSWAYVSMMDTASGDPTILW